SGVHSNHSNAGNGHLYNGSGHASHINHLSHSSIAMPAPVPVPPDMLKIPQTLPDTIPAE
ncbi:MAG: hypothetical protein IJR43_09790, partial [Synergistaceae bacterium]|nr:hypothetical protein [Synergistaceae bacterium]